MTDQSQMVETIPVVAESPRLADRGLPALCDESRVDRWAWLVVAAIIVALYGFFIFTFWAPADGGVDQNAYLLGGRMIAEHFTPRYTLTNPYQYVGWMVMRTSKVDVPGGDYYPKYPFGLPLLYALVIWIAGPLKATTLAFLISPVSALLALGGLFFVARLIAGSYAAVMAVILLGTSQLMIALTNNPNSHVPCTAFVIWGMYWLIKWWQLGGVWRGTIAGFLIGYAALVRYSEGLLILPIAVACASRLRWTDWRSYLRNAVPGLAWAFPVTALLIVNKCTMGSWTGYSSTNESEGFTWLKFTETWEQMIRTYYDMGAFFVLPLGLVGIMMLFRRSWQLGLLLLLWLLPGTALYTAYYWSPDRFIDFARFFLTFIPAVMLGVAICFKDCILTARRETLWYHKLPRVLSVGMVVITASALGVYRSVHGLQQGQPGGGPMSLIEMYRQRQSIAITGKFLLEKVPANSVLICDNTGGGNEKPLNYIQFLRHWDVYASDAFEVGGPARHSGAGNLPANADLDPNTIPTDRQQLQLDYLDRLYKNKKLSDLMRDEAAMINSALAAGHGVFVLTAESRDRSARLNYNLVGKYKITKVAAWSDIPPSEPDPVTDNMNNNGARGNRTRPNAANAGGLGNLFNPAPKPVVPADANNVKWELLELKPKD